MATNLELDDELIEKAKTLGHYKSKKAAVTAALEEYVQHHLQVEIIQDFGKIEYDASYDYKKQRKTA
jgi:hypothetical protein